MTNEEARKIIKQFRDRQGNSSDDIEAFDMAIKVLKQQPNRCDSCIHSEEQDGSNCYECIKGMADNFEAQLTDVDCISRERLLARIDAERKHLLDIKMDGAEHIIVHHVRRIIEDMPSVTPKAEGSDSE